MSKKVVQIQHLNNYYSASNGAPHKDFNITGWTSEYGLIALGSNSGSMSDSASAVLGGSVNWTEVGKVENTNNDRIAQLFVSDGAPSDGVITISQSNDVNLIVIADEMDGWNGIIPSSTGSSYPASIETASIDVSYIPPSGKAYIVLLNKGGAQGPYTGSEGTFMLANDPQTGGADSFIRSVSTAYSRYDTTPGFHRSSGTFDYHAVLGTVFTPRSVKGITTTRPQYTGWHPSLVIPEYRYLSNKLLFATEFGWAGQSITINNGTTGPLDLISGKRANTAGANWSQNSYELSNFGTYLNFADVSVSTGFEWGTEQNLAWWVNARDDIPVTIEGLIYLDSSIADTFTNGLVTIGSAAPGQLTFTLLYDTDHWELYGNRRTDSSYQRAQSSDSFPTDRWVHVVCTIPAYGFGTPELYIDSKIPNYSAQSVGSGNSGTQTDTNIQISQYSGGSEFKGKMAYLRVYQGVLTQDDVNKLYKDPFGILRQSPRGFEWIERRPTIRVRARGRG